MLGGGNFTTMTKVLPGAYINFESEGSGATTSSDRGYVGYAHSFGWGEEDKIVILTADNFMKNSEKIFGYKYSDEKLLPIREIFANANVIYTYKLASGGTRASNTLALAKYPGSRGNDIKIAVSQDVDDEKKMIVDTYLDISKVDSQTVTNVSELKDNDYVTFKKDAEIKITAATPLQNGSDGTVDASAHSKFLSKLEAYSSVNTVAYDGEDQTIAKTYAAWSKRMRENVGTKVQAVLYNIAYDNECVINVVNCKDIVAWVAGLEAGLGVNESAMNVTYDGEVSEDVIKSNERDSEALIDAIKKGQFVIHNVDGTPKVLKDINSLVTFTNEKGSIFSDNKTIRVIDQIARDVTQIFNETYLGGDTSAETRESFKSDIKKEHDTLVNIKALESYDEKALSVNLFNKDAFDVIDAIEFAGTAQYLYMNVKGR